MRFISFCFGACLFCIALKAQTITRGAYARIFPDNLRMDFTVKPDIFRDYWWSFPDIKSKEIQFNNNEFDLLFKSRNYRFSLEKYDTLKVTDDEGNNYYSGLENSHNDIYYDKHILPLKTDTSPSTGLPWQRIVDVPEYQFFNIVLPDGSNLILYRDKRKYYLQNISYIFCRDEDRSGIIFVDNDVNGSYNDPADGVIFFTLNKFYHDFRVIQEGIWYSERYLRNNYFISFGFEGDKLNIINRNDPYYNNRAKGTIKFKNLPAGACVIINGQRYASLNNRSPGYSCQFGLYHIEISQKGHLDFDTAMLIDSMVPERVITYPGTPPCAFMKIKNNYHGVYSVLITDTSGYRKCFINKRRINIPQGHITFEVQSGEFEFRESIDLKANDTVRLSF
jgi:hypothetical protein